MSNPCMFTQATFTTYAKTLLTDHSLVFVDEEQTATKFAKGGDHAELARMACDVDTSHMTISNEDGELGTIFLVNEYDFDKECQTVEIYNHSLGVDSLVPQDEDED